MPRRRVIFTRKIESELLRWKNTENRKPIVLRGARQVGKTFVVNRFARHFDHIIDINLERPRERDLFSRFNTGQELFERILLYKGRKIDSERTLLLIDEIQHSAAAVQSLRYLYEDMIIPMEVKSGKRGKLRSLNLFMENSPHQYAIRVYSGKCRIDRIPLPSGKKYHLCSIPYYLLSRLDDVIERFVSEY